MKTQSLMLLASLVFGLVHRAWAQPIITALSQSNNFIVTLTDTNATAARNFYRVSAPAR